MFNNAERAPLELEKVLKQNNIKKIQVLAAGTQKKLKKLIGYFQDDPNYFLTTANNGFLAVQLVKLKDYDIVLMNNKIPVLNGIDAIKWIRALGDPKKNKIPIIFASTSIVGREDRNRLLMLKAITVFKSYTKEQLIAKMVKALYQPMLTIPEESPFLPSFNRERKLRGPEVIIETSEASRLLPEKPKVQRRLRCCAIL